MGVAVPESLGLVAGRVDDRLEEFLVAAERRWTALDSDLAEPVSEIRRLALSGGKRLRPAFCSIAFVGMGGDPDDDHIVDACSALELLHVFALFHDDIIDDAATRRGQPTTHQVLAERHQQRAFSGEARRFGEGLAILIGDLTFVYSDILLTGAGPVAWDVWNELRLEVNAGQILDVIGSAKGTRDVDQAERIATYKSAKYTVERPLHLGAAIAAPDRFDEVSAGLSEYGVPLGLAFQMRDDVIGAFGDPSVTGKPVGDDLVEGKPTPLLARAVASADDQQLAVLRRVGTPDLTTDDIAEIQDAIRATGALDELESEIWNLTDRSIEAAKALPLTDWATDQLIALATYTTQRTT